MKLGTLSRRRPPSQSLSQGRTPADQQRGCCACAPAWQAHELAAEMSWQSTLFRSPQSCAPVHPHAQAPAAAAKHLSTGRYWQLRILMMHEAVCHHAVSFALCHRYIIHVGVCQSIASALMLRRSARCRKSRLWFGGFHTHLWMRSRLGGTGRVADMDLYVGVVARPFCARQARVIARAVSATLGSPARPLLTALGGRVVCMACRLLQCMQGRGR